MGLVVEQATRRCGGCSWIRGSRGSLGCAPVWAAGVTLAALALTAGCSSGSGGSAPPPPPPAPAVTKVTLVLSSTANDQLSEFDISFQSLSLTSASGKTVSLLSQARQSELIHVNGVMEPLLTTTIPQDTYTAATVTIGNAAFTCVTLLPTGSLDISSFAYGQTPNNDVTVTLPSPVTVSGDTMGLVLDMQVSQSASYATCGANASSGITPYAITPAFTLSGFAFPSQPATPLNGAVSGLDAQITALDNDAGGFQILLPTTSLVASAGAAPSIHVTIDSATIWQGIAGFTDLGQGTFVDLDGAVQGDGSIAATRVAVEDPSAVDVQRGPLLLIPNSEPILDMYPRMEQGKDERADEESFNFSGSTFQISGQFSNLESLPFTPSFTAANMVPGQNVYITSPAFFHYTPPNYLATATTVTLMPQTVNGTVFGIGASGAFTVYSVSLASYDLFPTLAIQQGQTALLSNPSVIEVYADGNTTGLTPWAPALGDTLRFYGLVFNDHGTLRMDCAQISAGVSSSQ
jgi:hypothetical protein